MGKTHVDQDCHDLRECAPRQLYGQGAAVSARRVLQATRVIGAIKSLEELRGIRSHVGAIVLPMAVSKLSRRSLLATPLFE